MEPNSVTYSSPCITTITALSEPHFHLNDYIGAGYLTPPTIATAYNIPASTGAGVKIGIISLGGGWLESDLNNSMSDLGISFNANTAVTTVLVDGATNTFTGSNYDYENTLDLYCVAGMAPAANIVMYMGVDTGVSWYTNSALAALFNGANNGFANVINRAISEECDIITISYGLNEVYSDVYPNYYLGDYLQAPLSSAAAKGISVLISAGDFGSQASTGANITTPSYPATSQYAIAVGGTNLQLTAGNLRLTETVEWNNPSFSAGWGSGGGISTYVPLPSWQSGLTYQRYFSSNATTTSPIALTTRGIPDISGPMNGYVLYINGGITAVGGTSAAAPTLAGMFARFMSLNGGRRPPPNAIHSVLYGNLSAYYDILSGNNATVAYSNGYAASSNWDPVTGVGVPWGNVVYPMVSSGGTVVKTGASAWSYLSNVKVKTDTNTWSNVKAIWTKTTSGWKQTF